MYDDFYTAPLGEDKEPLRAFARYENLKARLGAVAKGSDSWVKDTMAADPKIQKEIVQPDAVKTFCTKWLNAIVAAEAVEKAAAEKAAAAATAAAAAAAAATD